jgi:hypothetical protein
MASFDLEDCETRISMLEKKLFADLTQHLHRLRGGDLHIKIAAMKCQTTD